MEQSCCNVQLHPISTSDAPHASVGILLQERLMQERHVRVSATDSEMIWTASCRPLHAQKSTYRATCIFEGYSCIDSALSMRGSLYPCRTSSFDHSCSVLRLTSIPCTHATPIQSRSSKIKVDKSSRISAVSTRMSCFLVVVAEACHENRFRKRA